jgi:hypothetical protein
MITIGHVVRVLILLCVLQYLAWRPSLRDL